MNKLIERLDFVSIVDTEFVGIRKETAEMVIKALKAADAAVNELEMSGDPNNPYAAAYRNLTQETPHAG